MVVPVDPARGDPSRSALNARGGETTAVDRKRDKVTCSRLGCRIIANADLGGGYPAVGGVPLWPRRSTDGDAKF